MRRTIVAAGGGIAVLAVLYSCDSQRPTQALPPAGGADAPLAAVSAVAAQQGAWTSAFRWPVVAAHVTLLPNGNVISWVSSDAPGTLPADDIHIWNPASGAFASQANPARNVFCSGHTVLTDGRLLVAGGHIANVQGVKETNIFTPSSTDPALGSWSAAPQMRAGRWYPTLTTLVNGHVLVVAGTDSTEANNEIPEVWNGTGWNTLDDARLGQPYYPWMYSAPDGRVFAAGPDAQSYYLNPSGEGEWSMGAASSVWSRDYGSSVMYAPGKILIAGGGDPPTTSAEIIDLNGDAQWHPTGSMNFARRQMTAAMLPNGHVLVVGGSNATGFNAEEGAILAAESWNPATGQWTVLAGMNVLRMYHSTAVLLPDARVLVAGGGYCGTCSVHEDAEVYSPPYLFKSDGTAAARPTIASAPTSVAHGQTFNVGTPNAAAVARVTIVRLPSVTHSFNQNQTFDDLSFTRTKNMLKVTAPATPHRAPPGHYMLFLLDAAGVPSRAAIVAFTSTAPLPPAPGGGSITLAASVTTVAKNGQSRVQLTWSGATTPLVTVVRASSEPATFQTENDGDHVDVLKGRTAVTSRYRVCDANGGACSNEVTVTL